MDSFGFYYSESILLSAFYSSKGCYTNSVFDECRDSGYC